MRPEPAPGVPTAPTAMGSSTAGSVPYHVFKTGGYFLKQVLIRPTENLLY